MDEEKRKRGERERKWVYTMRVEKKKKGVEKKKRGAKKRKSEGRHRREENYMHRRNIGRWRKTRKQVVEQMGTKDTETK